MQLEAYDGIHNWPQIPTDVEDAINRVLRGQAVCIVEEIPGGVCYRDLFRPGEIESVLAAHVFAREQEAP